MYKDSILISISIQNEVLNSIHPTDQGPTSMIMTCKDFSLLSKNPKGHHIRTGCNHYNHKAL